MATLGIMIAMAIPTLIVGQPLPTMSGPTLPQGRLRLIKVSNQKELLAAINNMGPRRIVLQKNITLTSWAIIGGQFGNDAVTKGRDVEIDGQSHALLGRGLMIEKNCQRIHIHDLAIYPGRDSVTVDVKKAAISDPLTIAGMTASASPPTDITVENCAFGFGGDMNVQCEGHRVWFRDCMSFYGLNHPNHPKSDGPPHSKAFFFAANEHVQNSSRRLQVAMTGCVSAFCDDRAPRLQGAVDFYGADNWICGVRLGANIDDHHTDKGFIRATFDRNYITNCTILSDGTSSRTQAFSIFMGVQSQGRLRLTRNTIDGTLYDSPEAAWPVIDHQYSFGDNYAGTSTPEINRSYVELPVNLSAYSTSSDAKAHVIKNCGTETRDAIQTYVFAQMISADKGDYSFSLLQDEDDLVVNGKTGFEILD